MIAFTHKRGPAIGILLAYRPAGTGVVHVVPTSVRASIPGPMDSKPVGWTVAWRDGNDGNAEKVDVK